MMRGIQSLNANRIVQAVLLLLALVCAFRFALPLLQENRLLRYRLQMMQTELAEAAVFQRPASEREALILHHLDDAALLDHLEREASAADLLILNMDWQQGGGPEPFQGLESLRIPLQMQGELDSLRRFLDASHYPGLIHSLSGLSLERQPFLEDEYAFKMELMYWGSDDVGDDDEYGR